MQRPNSHADGFCCGCAGGELIVGPETSAAFETGNGSVLLRATAHVEYEGSKRKKKKGATAAQDAAAAEEADAAAAAAAAGGKALIVFTEMPYQVCKVRWPVLHSTALGMIWICSERSRSPVQHICSQICVWHGLA
jgi:hypothetical protein